MISKKAGFATTFREKVQTANGGRELWTSHSILHLEISFYKSVKMDLVMEEKLQFTSICTVWCVGSDSRDHYT